MSKTQEAKRALAIRREMRLRRDKTAAMMMQSLIANSSGREPEVSVQNLAKRAVHTADLLLAELDRTAPKESQTQGDDS